LLGCLSAGFRRFFLRANPGHAAGVEDGTLPWPDPGLCSPLVFFCVADCWMSWNTVQRVRGYGYTQVYWYKDGTDGWAEAGLPLVSVDPIPLGDD
jgi:rhodanese-related sulfurtransferase